MGGRGSTSTRSGGGGGASGPSITISVGGGGSPAPTPTPSVASSPPSAANTPVAPGGVTDLTKLSDDQLASLINKSKSVDMPNHLSDVHDQTQKFVYQAGLNAKPTVLSDTDFNDFLSDNGIPRSQIMARSVNGASYVVNGTRINLTPQQVSQMTKDSSLNYIGGKHGGQVYGAGTYFDMNGGRNTGYAGGTTMLAVLNPKTAKVVDSYNLSSMARKWAQQHPKSAKSIGPYTNRTMSIYASCMGYNVIRAGSYHNVIDRSALVMRSRDL